MTRLSRIDWLQADTDDPPDGGGGPADRSCPRCGEPLEGGEGAPPRCPACLYPEDAAAWIDYDGC